MYGSLAVFFDVWLCSGTKIFSNVVLKNFSGFFFKQVSGDWNFQIKHSSIKQKPETTVNKDNVLKNLLLVSVDCVRHKKFPCGLGGHNIEDPTLLL